VGGVAVNRIELDDPRDFLEWREGSGGTVEIWDIQVGTERRKGKGRRLFQKLFAELGPGVTVFAITRADNEVAQQFYEACRFTTVNVLRRFYGAERGVDALMYLRKSGGPV
jgi:ribosomal protein S18 acetylase RimI-like enzyme